jgi:inner membrane protein
LLARCTFSAQAVSTLAAFPRQTLESLVNKHPLLSKTLVIGLLMLLLSIPLLMVLDVVKERSSYRDSAALEVARAHAGPQIISGPVLYWPYTETSVRQVKSDRSEGGTVEEVVVEKRVHIQFPTTMDTRSELATETRLRGIFPVTVYTSHHETQGRFLLSPIERKSPNSQITPGQPLVLMGVSDARGLLSAPRLQLGGVSLAVAQAPMGSQAPLPLAAQPDAALLKPGVELAFSLVFDLAGTGRVGWVPLADENSIHLRSPWPHPSFGGDFLPRTRSVSAAGFEASWQVPALSTQAQRQFAQMTRQGPGEGGAQMEALLVSLQDPVDVYRLSERATKYGMMFIVLTFAAFFALEMVKRWRIHPMQYLMIGAALVLFFLLLLSMAEHMAFVWAYLLASLSCIGLLGHYLRHVLGGWRPGLAMSGLLVALYGVLYGILVSEDNALIMGTLLLFGALATIMLATRKLDWYGVLAADPPAPASDRAA